MNKKSLILTVASLAIVVALSLGIIGSASADNSLRLNQEYVPVQGFGLEEYCEDARLPGDYCEYEEDSNAWWLYRNNTPPPTPTVQPPPNPNAGVPQSILNNNMGLYPANVCYQMMRYNPGTGCFVRRYDGLAYHFRY